MKRKRRHNGSPARLRDMFAGTGKRKGIDITIHIDTELVHILDEHRGVVLDATGVQLGRKEILEGLLRKVWLEKLIEATVLEGGAKVSDQIEALHTRDGGK